MANHLLVLILLFSSAFAGCGRVVFKPKGQQSVSLSPDQQQQLAVQQQQVQQRADQLDRDNQELESLLAQSRQQVNLLRDQIVATQDQLRVTADRLAASETNNTSLQSRTQALAASVQQSASAAIRPNSTLLRPLAVVNMPGVDVRQDGDVIRIAISSDQLFQPGSAQWQPGAEQLIRSVASEVFTNYPEQRIGIEGHTDGAPASSPQYPTTHHLSVGQATAVFDLLSRELKASPQQLFMIGHGSNHPLASNATEAGRAKNRRIELVIYPESINRR
jgi:flagellar motor protein MotB